MRTSRETFNELLKSAEQNEKDKCGGSCFDGLVLDLRDAMEAVKILNELKYKAEAGEPLKNRFYA